jgi:hypothetical protein
MLVLHGLYFKTDKANIWTVHKQVVERIIVHPSVLSPKNFAPSPRFMKYVYHVVPIYLSNAKLLEKFVFCLCSPKTLQT